MDVEAFSMPFHFRYLCNNNRFQLSPLQASVSSNRRSTKTGDQNHSQNQTSSRFPASGSGSHLNNKNKSNTTLSPTGTRIRSARIVETPLHADGTRNRSIHNSTKTVNSHMSKELFKHDRQTGTKSNGSSSRRRNNKSNNDTVNSELKTRTRVSKTSSTMASNIRAKLDETRQSRRLAAESNSPMPPLTQAYCDYLLAECVSHDEWELVLDVLTLMKEVGLYQVRSTYAACLQSCFQNANAQSARDILAAMTATQIPPSTSDYALVIMAMCRKDQSDKGWWRSALELLLELTRSNNNDANTDMHMNGNKTSFVLLGNDLPLAVYDAILTCMVKDRRWKESIRLLRLMEQPSSVRIANIKTKPALSTYRTVIECCVVADEAEQAVQVLQSCVTAGLVPTFFAFELVIGALTKKLQWRRALQMLDLMEELGVPRSLQVYNFVLASCAKAREAVPAKALLQRMRRIDGISPNIISFNSVLSACASASQWRDALAVLDSAHREPGVTPDIYTYTKYVSFHIHLADRII